MDYTRYIEQEDLDEIVGDFNVEETISYLVSIVALKIKRRLNQVLKDGETDLSPEQFFILGTLRWHGAMTLSELAYKSHKDNANITRMVDLLEKKSFVLRTQDDEDKRATKLVLTEEGMEAYKNGLLKIVQAKSILLPGVEGEDLENYKEISLKLIDNYDRNTSSKY